jgi:hypothetical protein
MGLNNVMLTKAMLLMMQQPNDKQCYGCYIIEFPLQQVIPRKILWMFAKRSFSYNSHMHYTNKRYLVSGSALKAKTRNHMSAYFRPPYVCTKKSFNFF